MPLLRQDLHGLLIKLGPSLVKVLEAVLLHFLQPREQRRIEGKLELLKDVVVRRRQIGTMFRMQQLLPPELHLHLVIDLVAQVRVPVVVQDPGLLFVAQKRRLLLQLHPQLVQLIHVHLLRPTVLRNQLVHDEATLCPPQVQHDFVRLQSGLGDQRLIRS